MTLEDKENALFAEWARSRKDFVRDGVANESLFLSSTPRVIYVLKEVNDTEGGWDLREFMRSGGRSQTWNNITRWTMGIQSLDRDIPWSELATISEECRQSVVPRLCGVNLKKSPGGHTTDVGGFSEVVKQDSDFIRRQLALYDAQIAICCGSIVGEFYRDIFKLGRWKYTSRGIAYQRDAKGTLVISYSHPEARVQESLLHYGLVDAVRELLRA